MARIRDLDPATYVRHTVHQPGRTWAETNCYTDVVIELLHGLGLEPFAAMAFTLAVDFDVDQWTFFKFHPADVERLYGLGIHELAPWRPLAEHVEAHVAAGRPVLVELDSFYLPDTEGTAYRRAHVKSTVAVNEIDLSSRRMGYFHNQGYHALEGDDFALIFQVDGLVHPRMLPPYIEFAKALPGRAPLEGARRVEASLVTLQEHLARAPQHNPFVPFRERFEADLDWLLEADLAAFHEYSFVTLRQLGACYELASSYLRWLGQEGVDDLAPAADALDEVSRAAKALQFQLARAVLRRRRLSLDPIDQMGERWQLALDHLRATRG